MDETASEDWIITTKDWTDHRRGSLTALSSAIYYTSKTSSLTSFFSYSSDRYGYATGSLASDWIGVNYQSHETVSIVASTSPNDCIGILEGGTVQQLSTDVILEATESFQDADFITDALSVQSFPDTEPIAFYKEERVFGSTGAQMLTEPWFACKLVIEPLVFGYFAEQFNSKLFYYNSDMRAEYASFAFGGAEL